MPEPAARPGGEPAPGRLYEVEAFAVHPLSQERTHVRTARFGDHATAERWLIAHVTRSRPFGQGVTYPVERTDTGRLVAGAPDGWCYLDNAADRFDYRDGWLPRRPRPGLDVD